MTLYTKKVHDICSAALVASNIRHPPITSRIKSWDSAKGSLRRRAEERLVRRDLCQAVEAQGRSWEDYTRETGLESSKDEMGFLTTPAEILATLHDFGGVRIFLYFPGDLDRVAAVLQGHFDIVRQVNKGLGPQVGLQGLRERLEYFQDSERARQGLDSSKAFQTPSRLFTGYRATHFIVKLRGEDLPPGRAFSWKDLVVEIQVGTLVMHVWSEIEHDMIYKPLSSQGEKVSEDEERILDLINGIVLTGESALRQLEASTTKRLDKRAKDKDTKASSYFELATWIETDCAEREVSLVGDEWKLLEQLFTILKVTGDHKHSRVTSLIDYAVQQTLDLQSLPISMHSRVTDVIDYAARQTMDRQSLPTSIHSKVTSFLDDGAQKTLDRQSLPTSMLLALCNDRPIRAEWRPSNYSISLSSLAQNARLLALRLIHALNIAIYLGVDEEFLALIERWKKSGSLPSPPSVTTLLDILHPSMPRYSSPDAAEGISKFCEAILALVSQLEDPISRLVKLAIDLPATNLVGMLVDPNGSQLVPVPGMVTQILPIADDVSELETPRDVYRTLDFIGFYLSMDGKKYDKLELWDRLSARSLVDVKEPGRHRNFVPTVAKADTSGRWKLTDNMCPLNLHRIDPEILRESSEQIKRLESESFTAHLIDRITTVRAKPSEGVFKLAYHLHPKDNWRAIRKAIGIAEAFRLGTKNPKRVPAKSTNSVPELGVGRGGFSLNASPESHFNLTYRVPLAVQLDRIRSRHRETEEVEIVGLGHASGQ